MWPIRHNPFPSSLNPLQLLLHEWEELLSPVSLCRLISEHLRTMLLSARHGSKLLMKQLCQPSHLNPLSLLLLTALMARCGGEWQRSSPPECANSSQPVCLCSPEKEDFCSLTLRAYFSKAGVCFALSAPWFQVVEWGVEEAGSHWALDTDISCPRATPAFQASCFPPHL